MNLIFRAEVAESGNGRSLGPFIRKIDLEAVQDIEWIIH
jgi:hypothetical protein